MIEIIWNDVKMVIDEKILASVPFFAPILHSRFIHTSMCGQYFGSFGQFWECPSKSASALVARY